MLALNHASLAITCALTASIYYDKVFFLPLLIFVIFAGVFPDIDHPGSELGKYFKPVGYFLPHRGITHSILGASLFTVATFYLNTSSKWVMALLVFGALMGCNIAHKIFKEQLLSLDQKTKNLISQKQTQFLLDFCSYIINTFLIIVLILIWKKEYGRQIFLLLSLGYFAHLIGDFVTIEGIPLFWPLKQKFGLKLFKTGGKIEAFIGFILFVTNIYLLNIFSQKFGIMNQEYWLDGILN